MSAAGIPEYSFIVPAFNEEELLPKCLESLKLAAGKLPFEIIVVDNNSTDNTAKIAAVHGAKVVFESHRQIAAARNAGAKSAQGSFLFFVDADTVIEKPLFDAAVAALNSGKVVGGGAVVGFNSKPQGLARLLLRFWTLISTTMKLAAGCFIFCRKEAFAKVGGFDTRLYASEELRLSQLLKDYGRKRSLKFIILDMPGIISSDRKNRQTMTFLATILVFSLFPVAVRFRSLCFLWYGCRHQRRCADSTSE